MKQKPTKKCENGVQLRPASIEEAGLFYSELDQKQDEALGTVLWFWWQGILAYLVASQRGSIQYFGIQGRTPSYR